MEAECEGILLLEQRRFSTLRTTEAKFLGITFAPRPRRSERIDAAHEVSNLICYYLLAFGIAEGLDGVMEGKVEMVLLGPAVGASDFTFTLLLS